MLPPVTASCLAQMCSTEHRNLHQSVPSSLSGAAEFRTVTWQLKCLDCETLYLYFSICRTSTFERCITSTCTDADTVTTATHADKSVQSDDVWTQQIRSDHLQMTVRVKNQICLQSEQGLNGPSPNTWHTMLLTCFTSWNIPYLQSALLNRNHALSLALALHPLCSVTLNTITSSISPNFVWPWNLKMCVSEWERERERWGVLCNCELGLEEESRRRWSFAGTNSLR